MQRVVYYVIAGAVTWGLWSMATNANAMQRGVTDDGTPDIGPGEYDPTDYDYLLSMLPSGGDVAGTLSADEEARLLGWTKDDVMNERIAAAAFMVRASECGLGAALDNSCYQLFYGGAHFNDMSDHPVSTGELKGVPLPAAMCIRAGYPDGKCVSTAAGAYQLIRPNWRRFREADPSRGWARLPDFSMASQDEAFRRNLIDIGALDDIESGDLQTAIKKMSKVWASLPGNAYGQNPKNFDTVVAFYDRGLNLYQQGIIA